LPEIRTVRYESLANSARLAFACFQSDFLGEHNVANRQRADRHETQTLPPAASVVDLAYVHRGPGMDSVSPSGLAADNLKVSFPGKLLTLRWR
jgi:hypothetical protein